MGEKFQLLKSVFGHASFRPNQEEAVDAIVSGQDVMMILPTGAGKSLCYQLPSMLMGGVTVVISPLLALMHDQITALSTYGIAASMISSMQTPDEIRTIIHDAKEHKLKFLYVAPERLKSGEFIHLLNAIEINFFVVDEAHCVSEWGHEFREDYRQLHRLRDLFPTVPITAFTATATHLVEQDILAQLRLINPILIRAKVRRDNLHISVSHRNGNGREQLLEFISKYENECGIVYTFTRKEAQSIAEFLSAKKIPAKAYHAGLPTEQKNETYHAFLNDDIRVVVATVAFGMGIDKSNIRFVVHTTLPKTIENYYQEIGRAGRDGLNASTMLLFSASDYLDRKRMIDTQDDSDYKKLALDKLESTSRFASAEICRHQLIAQYFDDKSQACLTQCDNCLDSDTHSTDVTQDALKLLSCVYRTGQRFGLQYIVDVLIGLANEKIHHNGHNTLTVYGLGKDKSRHHWLILGDRLLELKALRQGNFRTLQIDQYGMEIIKNSLPITIRTQRLAEPKHLKYTDKTIQVSSESSQIFDQLRTLRLNIAKNNGVPPYVVFSDKTLQEMAQKLPQSKSEILQINGIGDVKYERYGIDFLELCKTIKEQAL